MKVQSTGTFLVLESALSTNLNEFMKVQSTNAHEFMEVHCQKQLIIS